MKQVASTENTDRAAFSDDPIGSPPGGGSWTWDGYDWVALEKPEPAGQVPAIEPQPRDAQPDDTQE